MTGEVESYCSHCGAKIIEPASQFCSHCGKATPLATTKNKDEDQRRKEANREESTAAATPAQRRRREGRDLPRSYTKMTDEEYYYNYRDASGAWFLLPIFFGFLGGIIMWLALRNEDPRKARDGLYVGIVFFIFWSIFTLFILSVASALTYQDLQPKG